MDHQDKSKENVVNTLETVLMNTHSLCFEQKYEKKKHYENMPFQIYRKFHLQKLKIFR